MRYLLPDSEGDQERRVEDVNPGTPLVSISNVTFTGSGASRTMTVSTVDGRSGTATLTITVS